LAVVSTVVVSVVLLTPSINTVSDGWPVMFSWHPVFMCISVVLLSTQGITSYVMSFGSKVNEQFPNRTSRRVMHGSIQIVSTAFAAMGVMTVIGTHSVNGLSNVGAGHVSNAYKVHAWLGYVSVGFILAQALSGLLKMVVKARDGRNILGCHGLSGMGVYLLCMATAISGFNAFFPDFTAWRIVVSLLLSLTALMAVLVVLFRPSRGILGEKRPSRHQSSIKELLIEEGARV